MRVKDKAKNIARFGAAAGLALGLTVAFQPAAGATGPELSVSSSTGLTHGSTVAVSVSGFTPNSTVLVGQCANVGNAPACPAGDPLRVTTDARGAASTALPVLKTFDAYRLDGTRVGTVDCATADCFVAAADPVCEAPKSEGVADDDGATREANGSGLSVHLSFV